jgi:hypothetical protein
MKVFVAGTVLGMVDRMVDRMAEGVEGVLGMVQGVLDTVQEASDADLQVAIGAGADLVGGMEAGHIGAVTAMVMVGHITLAIFMMI